MTGVNKEAQITQVIQETTEVILERVSYIHYLIQFWKNKKAAIRALINSGNKVNIMTSAYTAKLGLKFCSTNANAQKIDGSSLRTFEIVIANFKVEDKLDRARFF